MSFRLLVEFFHGWPLHVVTAALFAAVLIIAPQQAGLLVYKGSLIFGGSIAAYWVNRIMFHRPPPPKRIDGYSGGERTATATPTPTAHADTSSLFDRRSQRDIHADWQLCVMVSAAMIACAMAA